MQSLKTYVNPLETHAKETIRFLVSSGYRETQLEFPIIFGVQNHFVFPYQEKYSRGIGIYALCQGTQIIDFTTREVYN